MLWCLSGIVSIFSAVGTDALKSCPFNIGFPTNSSAAVAVVSCWVCPPPSERQMPLWVAFNFQHLICCLYYFWLNTDVQCFANHYMVMLTVTAFFGNIVMDQMHTWCHQPTVKWMRQQHNKQLKKSVPSSTKCMMSLKSSLESAGYRRVTGTRKDKFIRNKDKTHKSSFMKPADNVLQWMSGHFSSSNNAGKHFCSHNRQYVCYDTV